MISRTLTTQLNVPSDGAVTILEPNDSRDGFILHNMGGVIYVKLAKYSSVSNFTYRVPRQGTLEHMGYTGYVSAVAQNDASNIVVTELI